MTDQIVGREAELKALDEFRDGATSAFACVALEGEAGVGKTTVWQEVVRRSSSRGTRVLRCRPARPESRMSFAALGDLLDDTGDEVVRRLPPPQRRALEVALLRASDDNDPPDQRAIGVAVLSSLRVLASSAPVLLAVDDAQWLDSATASLLEFVVRRLDAEPIGVLVAVRLGDQPIRTFDCAVHESRRQVVRLGGLGIGPLHELLSVRLGHDFPRPTLLRIEQACAGNPFYALEIARELLRAGEQRAGSPLPVPGDLRALVSARIRRLPHESRAALLAAAALSQPTVALVDELALQPAVEADIARVRFDGRVVFSHPLYAAAVYETTPMTRRRALHRQLAGQIEEIDERARHLALASTAPNEVVARALDEGAGRARMHGAWHSAAELLEQARLFTPADQHAEALRRGVTAAEHYAHAGDRQHASDLLDTLLREAPQGAHRAEALRLLGEIRYNDESFLESLRLFEQARQYASQPRDLVEIELDMAYAASQLWDNRGAATHVRAALEVATPLGDDGLLAQALAFRAMSEYLVGHGIEWDTIARAVALEDPHRLVPLHRTPRGVEGLLLMFAGRLAEARERLLSVRRRAVERGDESDLAFFLCWLAWLETQAGNLDAAQAHVNEASLVASLTGGKSMKAFARALSALVSAYRGDVGRARRECEEASELATQTTYAIAGLWIVVARCFAELSLGDVRAAWQAAEPLAAIAEAHRIGEPVGVSFLPDALEALIALGDLDRAERLLDEFERCAVRHDRVWALATAQRSRGLLQSARGDLAAAAQHYQQALAQHARIDMPFELARTLLCMGQVQRRRKLRKSARDALGQALAIFERIGTPIWAARTRAELARTHMREAPGSMTPSEQRVAEMAASGLTNRQIAERLFISPKTVEANLARAYLKLGIRSRAELGATLAARPLQN